MKYLLFLSMMLMPFTSSGFEYVTKASFQKLVVEELKKENVVVLTFTASWCPSCKELEPMLVKAEKSLKKGVKFVRVDVDKAKDLANGVRAIPKTLILKATSAVGFMGVPKDQKTLEEAIKKIIAMKVEP